MPKFNSVNKKYLKSYSEATLQSALAEIRRGVPKLTVALKYGIPRATLQFRLGCKFKKTRPGPNTYLSETEEQLLVNWISDSHKKGFPRRLEDCCASVKKFLDENPRETPFKDNIPGTHWYKSFLKRHPEITPRTPEGVTKASSNVSQADIQKWFSNIEHYLKEKNFFDILEDPSRVYNGDETCFHLCPKTGKVLAPKGSKNVYEVDQGNSKTNIIVMFTFSAAGDITPPMVIYPYKRVPSHIAANFPSNEWGIGISDNGWMKSELFYEYVANILYPNLQKKQVKFPVLFFVDGHKTHLTYQLSQLCSDLQIILIALYPNSTRILQPADVSCFRPLKAAWKHGVLKWRRNNSFQEINKSNFAPILKDVLLELTPDKISHGFKACGLFPWNVNSIDFSKCIGKIQYKMTEENATNIFPSGSLCFEKFKQLVGISKTKRIAEIAKDKKCDTSDYSDDFLILVNIYKEFANNANDPMILKPMLEDSIESNNSDYNVINEKYEQENVGTPQEELNIAYTTDQILDMPMIILDKNKTQTQSMNDEANLNNSSLENYLLWQRTPERTGTRQTERLPYVITSTAYKNMCEKKIRTKQDKEKEKARKIANQKKVKREKEEEKARKLAIRDAKKNTKTKLMTKKKILRKKIKENNVMSEQFNQEEFEKVKKFKTSTAIFETPSQKVSEEFHWNNLENNEKPKTYTLCDVSKKIHILENIAISRSFLRNAEGNTSPKKALVDKTEPHKRILFEDAVEDSQNKILNLRNNIQVYDGLCFICVKKIYDRKCGIKCIKCSRVYHYLCLVRKQMYKENYCCQTCLKSDNN